MTSSKLFSHTSRIIFSLLLAGMILAAWHYKVQPLHKLSLQVNDLKYSFNPRVPHDDIVFVTIGEKSVSKWGRWPWDRQLLATKLQNLRPARTVVLDMVFSETTKEQKDNALADTVFDLGNVVCGFFLRQHSTKQLDPYARDILSDSALHRIFVKDVPFIGYPNAEVNILPISQNCALSGVFSTQSDSDSLFRRYPLAYRFGQNIYPSLGVQAMRFVKNKDVYIEQNDNTFDVRLGKQPVPMDENGFVLLDYYNIDKYNTISLVDVSRKDFDASQIEDKIVILGISEAGVSDIRATPLGQIPGPLIHYTFMSNVMQDSVLKRSFSWDLAFMLVLALIPIFLHRVIKRLSYRVMFYTAVAGGFVWFNIWVYIQFALWVNLFYPLFMLALLVALNSVFLFKAKESETKFIKNAFGNYMSPKLLDAIVKDPSRLKLGGEKRDVSIIFTDIRGFTTLSEKVSSSELISILELYFTPMTQIVLDNNGTLDKYIGDAIMAFYNAPVEVKNHPKLAVKTAVEMLQKLHDVNKKLESMGLPKIDFGAGINTGQAVVGNVGSTKRFDYSVIGDSVNLASRVEGLCKTYKVHIVITEFTKERIGDEYLTRELDSVVVKGKSKSVKVYEVMKETKQNKKIKALYEEALGHMYAGRLPTAKTLFEQCRDTLGDATAEQMLVLHFKN